MIKRFLSMLLCLCLFFSIVVLPTQTASAAPSAGLLRGKTPDSGGASTLLTDGVETYASSVSSGTYQWNFSIPKSITGYYFKATIGPKMSFLNASGQVIATFLPQNKPTDFFPILVNDVSAVRVETNNSFIYEVDVSDTFVNVPPKTPTNLVALPYDSSIYVSWDAYKEPSADLAGYNLYQNGVKLNASFLTDPYFYAKGITNGVSYTYQAIAVDLAGQESAASVTISATPSPLDIPTRTIKPPLIFTQSPVPGEVNTTDSDLQTYASLDTYRIAEYQIDTNYTMLHIYFSSDTVASTEMGVTISGGPTTITTYQTTGTSTKKISVPIPKNSTKFRIDSRLYKMRLFEVYADVQGPAAPKKLTAEQSDRQVALAWQPNQEVNLVGYNVYSNGIKVNTALITTTDYTVTGLTNDTMYTLTATAVDAEGLESAPTKITAVPEVGIGESPVFWRTDVTSDVNVLNVTDHDLHSYAKLVSNAYIDYYTVPNANKFLIHISEDVATLYGCTLNVVFYGFRINQMQKFKLYTETQTTFVLDVPVGATSVRVQRDNGSDASSNMRVYEVYFRTEGTITPPAAPIGVVAEPLDTQAKLSWTANSEPNIAGYNIYRDGIKLNTSPITGSTFTASGLMNGTTYSFTITAVSTDGLESAPSQAVTATPIDTTPPAAPTGVTATSDNLQIDLSWNANQEPDLAGYNIYQNGVKINTTPITDNFFTVTNLTNGTLYGYTITAVDLAGNESAPSPVVYETPQDWSVPAAPLNLNATAGDSQVSLDWSASPETNVIGYNIYQDGVKMNSSPLTNTSYPLTGLTNGTTYTYTVTAVTIVNIESTPSQAVPATPRDLTPPAAPTGVIATSGDGVIDLTWNANQEPDLAGYYIYQNGVQVNTTPITDNFWTATGLTYGTMYGYTITAVDLTGNESAPSPLVMETPQDWTAPSAPLNLNATAGDSQVTLAWSANPEIDVVGYNVYQDGVKINSLPVTSTTLSATGLTNYTTYSYVITAVDAAGNESTVSNTATAMPLDLTPPATPTGFTAINKGKSKNVDLAWDANTEADLAGYNIYVDGVKVNTALVTKTDYMVKGLTKGTTYTFTITAVDLHGNESTETIQITIPVGV